MLGSGSSGNTTLVSDGTTHILVDVGLSGRESARRLRECGLEPDKISAIVISHEHGDHCRGVGPFAKNLDIPVFMTEAALACSGLALDSRKYHRIGSGESFDINGILFTGFSVPHDAIDPLGFVIEKDGVKIGVAYAKPSFIIALPGPHQEAKIGIEVIIEGFKKGLDKEALALSLSERYIEYLKKIHN